MDNNQIEPKIAIVYVLFLSCGVTASDIWDMAINERSDFEGMVLGAAIRLGWTMSVDQYLNLPSEVSMFVSKYNGAFIADDQ